MFMPVVRSRSFASSMTLWSIHSPNTLGIYASRVNNTRHNSRREELLSQFIDLIEANFKTERAVNFYAEKLFVTPKHLSAVLKEISGKTAGEWIDHRVILEAKLLLRTTGERSSSRRELCLVLFTREAYMPSVL